MAFPYGLPQGGTTWAGGAPQPLFPPRQPLGGGGQLLGMGLGAPAFGTMTPKRGTTVNTMPLPQAPTQRTSGGGGGGWGHFGPSPQSDGTMPPPINGDGRIHGAGWIPPEKREAVHAANNNPTGLQDYYDLQNDPSRQRPTMSYWNTPQMPVMDSGGPVLGGQPFFSGRADEKFHGMNGSVAPVAPGVNVPPVPGVVVTPEQTLMQRFKAHNPFTMGQRVGEALVPAWDQLQKWNQQYNPVGSAMLNAAQGASDFFGYGEGPAAPVPAPTAPVPSSTIAPGALAPIAINYPPGWFDNPPVTNGVQAGAQQGFFGLAAPQVAAPMPVMEDPATPAVNPPAPAGIQNAYTMGAPAQDDRYDSFGRFVPGAQTWARNLYHAASKTGDPSTKELAVKAAKWGAMTGAQRTAALAQGERAVAKAASKDIREAAVQERKADPGLWNRLAEFNRTGVLPEETRAKITGKLEMAPGPGWNILSGQEELNSSYGTGSSIFGEPRTGSAVFQTPQGAVDIETLRAEDALKQQEAQRRWLNSLRR